MSNSYYNHSTFPVTGSAATSQSMRAELDLIAAGFDKLPGLTGNANKLVAINGTATGLTTIATSAQLAAAISDETGSGSLVFADSPTLTNPVITGGSYTPTTFVVPSGTGSTTEGVLQWSTAGDLLTIGTGAATKTFVDLDTSQTVINKTFNLANNTLVATSAQLAAAITDETGTGSLVFATSPALAGTPTAPTAAAGTNTTQLATTAYVFAERSNAFTLTNKTISGASNTLTNIGNSSLTNSSLTIGTTNIALGATSLTLAGLTSVAATTFTGALTGNASTATTLATTRTIWGQNFNGSANVTGALTSVTDITASGTLTSAQLNVLAQGDLRLEDASGGQYVALQAPATIASNFTLTLPDTAGASGQALITDGAGNLSWSTSASGDVYGPASATDNAVARFDSTTGKLIQNSGVIIDDSNNVTGVVNLTSSGSVTLSGGTANGVAYLNGSKVLTTGSALTFDGTTLALVASSASQAGSIYSRNTNGGASAYSGLTVGNDVSANKGGVLLSSSTASASGFIGPNSTYFYNTDGLIAINAQSNNPILFGVNNAEQMRLTSTGLGIGTSSPSVKLQVAGGDIGLDIDKKLILRTADPDAAFLTYTASTTIRTYIQSQYGIFLGKDYGAGNGLFLNASGNLGLGVTPSAWNSSYKAVQLGSATSLWGIASGVGGSFLSNNVYFDGTPARKYLVSSYASEYVQANGAHSWFTAPSGTAGNPITFTQAMTLDASGNLGVGTTSPSNYGKVAVFSDSGTTLYLSGGAGNYSTESGLAFSSNRARISGWIEASGGTPGASLRFYTMPTNGAITERMRIDSSGNVGIGTGSPGAPLAFADTAALKIQFNANAANYYGISKLAGGGSLGDGELRFTAGNTAGGSFTFSNGGTEKVRIDSSGNVGIGTSSPGERLTVQTALTGTTAGSNVVGRFQSNGSGYDANITLGDNVNAAARLGYLSGNMYFWTNGAERMRIDSSGNVGIGTSSPTDSQGFGKALDISSASYGGALYIRSSASASTYGWFGYDYTALASTIAAYGTNTKLQFNAGTGAVKMTLDSSGNLGLGVTPSAWNTNGILNLKATGAVISTGNGITIGSNWYYNAGYKYVDSSFATWYEQLSGQHKWYTAPSGTAGNAITFTQAMTLDASGNLSIGTTTPTSGFPLTVYNASSGGIAFGNSTATSTIGQSAGNVYFDVNRSGAAGNLIFRNSSSFTETMRIDSSGNVGIGTSSPSTKLDIGGGTSGQTITFTNTGTNGTPRVVAQINYRTNSVASSPIIASYINGAFDDTTDIRFYSAAGNERMRIDSSGNVGIGVTPSAWRSTSRALQIGSTSSIQNYDNGGTIAVAVGNNYYWNSSDQAIYIQSKAATNYYQATGQHVWQTAPSGTAGNAISWTQAMTLDASGNLGVGTTSSSARLRILSTASQSNGMYVTHPTSNQDVISCENSGTTGDNTLIRFYTDSTIVRGAITYNRAGGVIAYNTSSDYRLKENIVDLPNALQTVYKLKPRQFDWKETGNTTTGFIAHELAEVLPHAVTGEKDAVDAEGKPVYQGIDTSFLVATLTKAIQEQQQLIEALTARVAQLEGN